MIEQAKKTTRSMRMRRSGQGAAGRAVKTKQHAVPGCPHLERRWVEVPHPRYGDKVPHFTSFLARPGVHDCVSAP